MKLLATINHNDPDRGDRIGLFAGPNGNVWAAAADEDAYDTDVPIGNLETSWGGPMWGLHTIDDNDAYRYAVQDQGFTGTIWGWLKLNTAERLENEAGAAGIPTE